LPLAFSVVGTGKKRSRGGNRMRRIAPLVAVLAASATLPAAAVATGPPETWTSGPFTFMDVDPCTGEEIEVTTAFTNYAHSFELTDPARHHEVFRFRGTISTDAGHSGRIVGVVVDNGAGAFGEEEGQGMATVTITAIAATDDGARFRRREVLHLTVVDGQPAAERESLTLKCLGG
jgi:hypothetical protein